MISDKCLKRVGGETITLKEYSMLYNATRLLMIIKNFDLIKGNMLVIGHRLWP